MSFFRRLFEVIFFLSLFRLSIYHIFHVVQHCSAALHSVPKDAGIEPKTVFVAELALIVSSKCNATSHNLYALTYGLLNIFGTFSIFLRARMCRPLILHYRPFVNSFEMSYSNSTGVPENAISTQPPISL
jgi:hypothetical protein